MAHSSLRLILNIEYTINRNYRAHKAIIYLEQDSMITMKYDYFFKRFLHI